MNVVVIAPHPDDEAIGCGGSICLQAERDNRVTVVFLTSGELGLKKLSREEVWKIREQEAERAAEVLGVADLSFLRRPDWYVGHAVEEAAAALRPVLEREAPRLIYLPHTQEWHPDHRACLPVVRRALESSDLPIPTLLTYEVWTPLAQHDDGEDITSVMRRKLKAIRCYRSQLDQLRYDRAVRGLNQYRGALAWKCRYAEVFEHAFMTSAQPPARPNESGKRREP
ncbi:MAG TPA: PIG-L deacetylase family protein [Gemmataceae bacterium]|nr:PIG-L deacetylase family protein [Gemmataceae bacterium]